MRKVSALVAILDAHDPANYVPGPDGTDWLKGAPLRRWITRLGGWRGIITNPALPGAEIDIDLRPFEGRDVDSTFVSVRYDITHHWESGKPLSECSLTELHPREAIEKDPILSKFLDP